MAVTAKKLLLLLPIAWLAIFGAALAQVPGPAPMVANTPPVAAGSVAALPTANGVYNAPNAHNLLHWRNAIGNIKNGNLGVPLGTVTASGAISTASTTITMPNVSGSTWFTPGLQVWDNTTNKIVGTTKTWVGTTLTLTTVAASASPAAATISSGTYVSGTGVITLTLSAPLNVQTAPFNFTLSSLTGTGAFASLDGTWTTLAGTNGSTVVLQGPVAAGAATITGGSALSLDVLTFTRRPRIVTITDSQGIGTGAGTGGNTALSGARPYMWPAQLAKMLTTAGIPASFQAFFGDAGVVSSAGLTYPVYDPSVTMGANWSFLPGYTIFGGETFQFTTGAINNLAYTPPGSFDTVVVMTATGGSGTGAVNVDGGSSLGTIPANQTGQNVLTTFSAPTVQSGGTHIINIVPTNDAGFFVMGEIAFNSTVGGVDIISGGIWGAGSATFNQNGFSFSPLPTIGTLKPDITILAVGGINMDSITTVSTITSGTYNSSTGVVTLTMSAPVIFGPGIAGVQLTALSGTGNFASLAGVYATATLAGTGGTTVVMQAPTGFGAATITGGTLVAPVGTPSAVASAIASWVTDMQALITEGQLSGDVLLMTWAPPNTTQWQLYSPQFVAALQHLAVTNNCVMIDLNTRWTSWAYTNPVMPYFDFAHPTRPGHLDIATAISQVLTSPRRRSDRRRRCIRIGVRRRPVRPRHRMAA